MEQISFILLSHSDLTFLKTKVYFLKKITCEVIYAGILG